ncbi:MAG: hypothetical protein M0Q95_10930 [Porticoccaceae bacterium]|nr:hypothetical protein [Porticoccaceae bacterium]
MTIETITRGEIAKLTGVSETKLKAIIKTDAYMFPKPIKTPRGRTFTYNKQAVMEWLEKHDIKALSAPAESYSHVEYQKQKIKKASPDAVSEFNRLAIQFLTGKRPEELTDPSGSGKTIIVHVPERDDYTPPSERTAWPASSSDRYRMTLLGNW